jgi:hypothetical protein
MDLNQALRKSLRVAQTGRWAEAGDIARQEKILEDRAQSRRSALQALKPALMTGFRQRFMRKIDGRQRPAKMSAGQRHYHRKHALPAAHRSWPHWLDPGHGAAIAYAIPALATQHLQEAGARRCLRLAWALHALLLGWGLLASCRTSALLPHSRSPPGWC